MSNRTKSVHHDEANTQGRKPKLRFPEFCNAPKWEETRLEEIFDFHSTANNSRADLTNTGDTFYIHYGDIHTKFHLYIDFSKDTVPKIASGLYRNATFLKNGDLVVADASEDTEGIAKAVEVRGLEDGVKAISGLHTILLRDSQKKYVNGFKGFLREIDTVKRQIKRLAVGVKVYAVSKTVLKQVLLPLPSRPEQQKIAECLSSIDELIGAQTQKLGTLKAHKNGLMQQLFPAEGETVPRLRFPEFHDAPGWKENKIDQISENVTAGGTPSTTEKEYWGGSIRWMNSGELNYKKVYEVKGRITEEGLRNSSTKIIPRMCVLIGLAGQGKTRGTVAMNMVELCINQSIAAIFPNEESFSSDFLYHNLDNRYDELRSLSAGGEGRGGLNLQIIKSLGVPLPRLKEQQKIADCLSSLDELIAAQTQKLDTLKAHKKGLMQRLFPSVDEVSG